ncbi:MAG: extracellular solute-binding protein, partial [Alphaproteobacteria bacterium]
MLKMPHWLLMIALAMVSPAIAESVHLRMTCQTDGKEAQLCKAGAERWSKKTGNTVEVIAIPHNQNDFAYLTQMMSSQSADIDVYVIDVVWVGSFAEHLVDLSADVSDEERARFFPAMLKNNIIEDRLVAIPWYTDAGLLYYRKDLLEKYARTVPTTWEELGETARVIQAGERELGNDKMWGFVFQARAQECLTCNAYEWLVSHNSGTLIDENGKLALDKENAVKALTLIQGFIGTITPQGVLNYAEEEARGIFQTGNAVFMRNWPYAWALANSPDSP